MRASAIFIRLVVVVETVLEYAGERCIDLDVDIEDVAEAWAGWLEACSRWASRTGD